MKKTSLAILSMLVAFTGFAQKDQERSSFGIKAGYNWSYITGKQEGFNSSNKSGFMAGGFYSAPPKSGMGYRTELVFSRQGYSFDDGGKNTDVMNDYIYLPQVATFNISRYFQLYGGGQIGYLINSKKTTEGKDSSLTSLMNRFDYGFAAGVEIYPAKALTVGGRYNLGLGKLYKHYQQSATNPYPLPFNPDNTDFKNAVIQFYLGYRF